MFIYKCALCLRALFDEGVMCGPCVEAMETFGPDNAKVKIDEMCAQSLDGMENKIPIDSVYAPARFPTITGKWYAAVQWLREMHARSEITSMIARRNRGKNSLPGFRDPDGLPGEGWKDTDGEDGKGDDCVR